MDLSVEKLEIVQLVLNTNGEEVLRKVRTVLKRSGKVSETEYLLANPANEAHLKRSMAQGNEGKTTAIKTEHLWK